MRGKFRSRDGFRGLAQRSVVWLLLLVLALPGLLSPNGLCCQAQKIENPSCCKTATMMQGMASVQPRPMMGMAGMDGRLIHASVPACDPISGAMPLELAVEGKGPLRQELQPDRGTFLMSADGCMHLSPAVVPASFETNPPPRVLSLSSSSAVLRI